MSLTDYYELLDIEPSADQETIKGAIRQQRRTFRKRTESPKNEVRIAAEQKLNEISQAEEILLDAQKRAEYDQQLKNQASQPAPQQPDPSAQPAPGGGDTTDWLASAKDYLANGQARRALMAATEATRTHNDVESWVVRAYAAMEFGNLQDADFAAAEAQRRDSKNPEIAGLVAEVADSEENYVEAERAFNRAAELEPGNPYWKARVAWAKSDKGRHDAALNDIRGLVDKYPDYVFGNSTLVHLLFREAREHLTRFPGEGLYFTEKEHVQLYESTLAETEDISPLNDNAKEEIAAAKQELVVAKKRRWIGAGKNILGILIWLLALTWIILYILPDNFVGVVLWLGINAGWGYWKFNQVYPIQWKINKRAYQQGR